VGGACIGLAFANALRAPEAVVAALVAAAIVAASLPRGRLPACAVALALAGWWWGSVRLEALEGSVLAPEVGRSAAVRVVVTGPVRRATFALRVPAEVRRFGDHVQASSSASWKQGHRPNVTRQWFCFVVPTR
jgi:hypothetical protein